MATTVKRLEEWLIASSESESLEFKEASTQLNSRDLYEYCVGIANENGGKLILGVTNKLPREVIGTKAYPNPQKTKEQVFQKLGFHVEVEEFIYNGKRVVIFHIPPRPKGTVYHFEGRYLMRVGESLTSMTEDRLRKIFAEGHPDWLSECIEERYSVEDVIRLLDTQSYFDLSKTPYPSTRDFVLQKFQSESFIVPKDDRWAITNLGAICFAKNLNDLGLGHRAPRVIIYEGTNKLQTQLDRTGQKGYAVGFEGLIEFIANSTPSNEVVTKAIRHEVKMFPDIAIRELVANALIHQDFTVTGTSIHIEIYSDRLEISNPGPPEIPTQRFIDEYKSRNDKLANIMRRLGICEEKGSGIDRVVNIAEAMQLPAPDFRAGSVHTSVVLFAHKEFSEMTKDDRIRACFQHCCLKYVMNEQMTNQSLRKRFLLPPQKGETISRVIRDTIDEGLINIANPKATSTRYRSYIPYYA